MRVFGIYFLIYFLVEKYRYFETQLIHLLQQVIESKTIYH